MLKLLCASAFNTSGSANTEICMSRLFQALPDEYLGEKESFWNSLTEPRKRELIRGLKKITDICGEEPKCESCPLTKYCNYSIEKLRKAAAGACAPVFVDLFCGAGGLSLGFKSEGYMLNMANDIEPCCIDTYSFNHPETPAKNIVCGDIKEILNNLKSLLQFETTDVVIGGPPCQGFSMANRQRLMDDPRNHLYKSYIQAVAQIHPKFVVMENVKGMSSVVRQVKEDFEAIGYAISAQLLNAKDFGVPQNRERLIFIGNRVGIDNDRIFEEIREYGAQNKPTVLADALYGLRALEASRVSNATEQDSVTSGSVIEYDGQKLVNDYISLINARRPSGYVFNHKARYNNDRDIEIFGRMNQGDRSDDPKIADIMPYKRRNDIFKDKYFKLDSGKVSKTITAHMKFDCNMYIHPTQARGLTPREAARVQSYPDDYFFRGPYTKTFMQVGNSVPPLLSRILAKAIKKYLE